MSLLLLVFGWALAAAPVDRGTHAPEPLTVPARTALAAADARTLAASSLSDTQLAALAADGGWRVRARAAAALQWRADPALATLVTTVAPASTRNGAPRFVDHGLRDPDAAALIVERLIAGGDDAREREALVEALRLTDGDWADAAAGLLATEPDAGVRAQLAVALRDADADAAWAGLTIAARDADARVRAAAMRAVAGRADGAGHAALVIDALRDTDAGVRGFAARAVGWLGLKDGWSGVVALLADGDAEVRLQALNALGRLDEARAGALPEVARLVGDSDGRVARAAARLRD